MSLLLLVVDGLADLPQRGKTPLSLAHKPSMDWFAEHGLVSSINLIPKGMGVHSHVANVSLLGYDPRQYYLRRGPLEAVGCELPFKEGELALRCNFATLKNSLVIDRRAGRKTFGLDELASAIQSMEFKVPFTFKRTYGHRAVLILHEQLSDAVSGNDPNVVGKRLRKIRAMSKEAEEAASLLRDFVSKAERVLKDHPVNRARKEKSMLPANCLLLREPGNRLQAFPNFCKRWGLSKALCIAEPGVMKATCMLAGFDALTVPELEFEESLEFEFECCCDALSSYDLVYVHVKGPDEAAHDGDFERKIKLIEALDAKLSVLRGQELKLVVTSDHITACSSRRHEKGRVPVLVYGKGLGRVRNFDELSARKGRRFKSGFELMEFLFKN